MSPRRLALLACAASVAWSGPTGASGLDAPLTGTPASGPLGADPAAVWHNPAVLTRLSRPGALFGGSLVATHIGYTRARQAGYPPADGLTLQPGELAEGAPARSGPAVSSSGVLPTVEGFFALPLPGGGAAGLGLHTPYGAPVAFDRGGPQRFALQEAFLVMPHVSAAVGWRLHERLSVGIGGSLILGLANVERVQDFAALDAFGEALAGPPARQPNGFGATAPPSLREQDALARPVAISDATATQLTFHAGLAVQATADLALALTYHHGAELVFEGDFRLDLAADLFTQDLSAVGLAYPPVVRGDARLGLVLPRRIEAAARYTLSPTWRLEGRLEYVTWSDLQAMRVALRSPQLAQPAFGLPDVSRSDLPRRWEDAVHLTALAHTDLEVGILTVGLGYHSPASPDATVDVASPDGHRITAMAGLDLPLTERLGVVAHLSLQAIAPRTVTTSDFDLGNGRYTLALFTAGAHLRYAWGAL